MVETEWLINNGIHLYQSLYRLKCRRLSFLETSLKLFKSPYKNKSQPLSRNLSQPPSDKEKFSKKMTSEEELLKTFKSKNKSSEDYVVYFMEWFLDDQTKELF